MTTSHDAALDDSKRRHQRDVLRYIVLPLVGGGLLIAVIMLMVVLLPRVLQVRIVSDFTVTALLLCPMALCLLPFSVGLMTLAILSGRVHPVAAKPLRRGEALTLRMRDRVKAIAERGARASISFNARLAPMTNWMNNAFKTERAALPAPKQDEGKRDDRPET
jgi:hypothetical protein